MAPPASATNRHREERTQLESENRSREISTIAMMRPNKESPAGREIFRVKKTWAVRR